MARDRVFLHIVRGISVSECLLTTLLGFSQIVPPSQRARKGKWMVGAEEEVAGVQPRASASQKNGSGSFAVLLCVVHFMHEFGCCMFIRWLLNPTSLFALCAAQLESCTADVT